MKIYFWAIHDIFMFLCNFILKNDKKKKNTHTHTHNLCPKSIFKIYHPNIVLKIITFTSQTKTIPNKPNDNNNLDMRNFVISISISHC